MRLLVVDDQPAVREILTAILELSDHEVIAVSSVSEAVTCLQRGSFDLVLSDVNLPGATGWGLLERVQRLQPAPPVLMISDERYREEALRRGATGFLAKPYKRSSVERTVQEILEGRE